MKRRKKASYIGAPAVFALELACRDICDAFNGYGCYMVGSALERADWRDVDVRFIMPDEEFAKLFPDAVMPCWEQDTRWLLLTVSISERLSKITGLPIDFQFQPQTHATEKHKGQRNAIGLRIAKPIDAAEGGHQHTDACYSRVPETEGGGKYLSCGKVAGRKP